MLMKSRNLTIDEFTENKDIQAAIARKTAHFHALDVPVKKAPLDFVAVGWQILKQFLEKLPNMPPLVPRNEKEAESARIMIEFDIEGELTWAERVEKEIGGRVVFGHGDINRR